MEIRPPQYALKFLRWFCRYDFIDEIEGDLLEVFEKQYERSPGRANRYFIWSVLKYFRPEFIKSFKSRHTLNHTTMFRHNLIVTYRNFIRHKSSFFINLVGLSTGLACALMIYLWVNDELNVDKFHEKDAQLYQILTTHPSGDGIDTWWEGPVPLPAALAEEMPEVESAVVSSGVEDNFTISYESRHFNASGQFADKNYFSVFSYPLIHGEKNTVLADKSSIVISEGLAMKLFNTTENVVGKSVDWEIRQFTKQFTVSGVFKNVPTNSSDQFDFVLSFEIFKDILGESANWGNHQAKVYLVLKEGTDIPEFKHKILNFIKTKSKNSNVTLLLSRYSDRYLYNNYVNGVQAGGRIEYVKLFSIIAVFILLIACINFMNLSTAKASRRIKEVGIKKAIGARRGTLVIQHLGESLILTTVSLLIALGLVALLLPQFNLLAAKQLSIVFDYKLVLSLLTIITVTGLIAGSYPALYLSGFNPATVLKGKLSTTFGEVWLRKGLVVFQFTLSVILIVSVVVVYKQIEYVQTKNVGFDRKHVIYFDFSGKVSENPEAFLSEVRRIPGVVYASSMWGSIVGETGVTQGTFDWEGKDPNSIYAFSHLGVNYDMLELWGLKMKEGRSFSRDFSGDTSKIIINEAGIEAMGLKNPVGKIFRLWGHDMEIIGVAKNFNFRSLHEPVKPFFFRLMPKDAMRVMIRMEAAKEKETIARLESFYKVYNPGFPLSFQFLDDQFDAQYSAEQRVSVLSRYFAAFAILISCLGLFGLAAFTAERRLKEISIRKILGSSEVGIVYLLSSDFTKIVLTSIVIALPISYFMTKQWLAGFAFRIDLQWWYFIGAGLSALIIALATVGIQTIKAARVNPTKCLKDE